MQHALTAVRVSESMVQSALTSSSMRCQPRDEEIREPCARTMCLAPRSGTPICTRSMCPQPPRLAPILAHASCLENGDGVPAPADSGRSAPRCALRSVRRFCGFARRLRRRVGGASRPLGARASSRRPQNRRVPVWWFGAPTPASGTRSMCSIYVPGTLTDPLEKHRIINMLHLQTYRSMCLAP